MTRIPYPYWLSGTLPCGDCAHCCGPVGITHREQGVIGDYCTEHSVTWKSRGLLECGFLDEDNHCLIYEVRPYICRAYGLTKEIPCPLHPEAARVSFPPEEARRQGLVELDGVLLQSVREEVHATS